MAMHGHQRGDIGEARVETAQAGEDQGLVGDGLTNVTQSIKRALRR
jgi:hypothetical protein